MRSKYRTAFDLTQESDSLRDAYGRSKFGQGCLLARRLVEVGVRFVQVLHDNFDQHIDHYPKQEDLMRELDNGMAHLIADLKFRGLLDSTAIVATGEFGRTPKMNKNKGRDHWVNGYSVAVAGGGFKEGYAYGKTTPDGSDIDKNPVTIPDFMATLCHTLGIDPEREYLDQFNRPIKLVDDGQVIENLLA